MKNHKLENVYLFTFKYPPAVYGSGVLARFLKKELEKEAKVRVYTTDTLLFEEHFVQPGRRARKIRKREGENVMYLRTISSRRHPLYLLIKFSLKLVDKLLNLQLQKLLELGPLVFDKRYFSLLFSKKSDKIIILPLGNFFNFYAYLYALLRNIPIIIIPCFHQKSYDFEQNFNLFLLQRANKILALSNGERDYLVNKGIDRNKINLLEIGLDVDDYKKKIKPRRFSFKKKKKDVILMNLGRMDEYKGIRQLVFGFKEALKVVNNIYLIIAGEKTEYSKKIKDLLRNHLPQSKYFYLERLSNQERNYLLSVSDLVVNLSKYESLSLVILEAWLMKKPAFVLNSEIFKEKITDKTTGILCNGSRDDIYRKIIWAVKNKPHLEKMGLSGHHEFLRKKHNIGKYLKESI